MNITLFRNGIYYSGLCLDEVSIKMKEEVLDIDNQLHQFRYSLEKLGYSYKDEHNNPFHKTAQFEYINEYEDKVYVRVDYKNKKNLLIGKQYNNIENCTTTVEVITRLGALNKLFNDIVKLFRDEVEESEEME